MYYIQMVILELISFVCGLGCVLRWEFFFLCVILHLSTLSFLCICLGNIFSIMSASCNSSQLALVFTTLNTDLILSSILHYFLLFCLFSLSLYRKLKIYNYINIFAEIFMPYFPLYGSQSSVNMYGKYLMGDVFLCESDTSEINSVLRLEVSH